MIKLDKENRNCGFIEFEEKEKSGKFIQQYLRLDKSKGILEWFADDPLKLSKDASAQGSIDINFITQVDTAVKVKSKAKHCFAVNTPMRKYYFRANDDDNMKLWVEILNNASKIVVSDEETDEAYQSLNGDNSVNFHEEYSYKTEIVAGVVIQKIVYDDGNTSSAIKTNSSRSHSLASTGSNEADLKSIRSASVVIKEGWAVKQGHVRKNWKRRFFILTTKGFTYHKTDHDRDPIRTIPLSDILAAKVDSNIPSSFNKDNLFMVVTTERIYYIQADNQQEMESWVKAFNDIVHTTKSLKHRTKGSEPGDSHVDVEQHAFNSNINVARRRKVESTLSVASPAHRNSTQVFVPRYGLPHSASPSPVAYYRLSAANDGHYKTMTPNKSQASRKQNKMSHDFRRTASSSEESGNMSSSVDSLNAAFVDSVQVATPPKPKKNKKYMRSISGSDMSSPLVKYEWLPPGKSNPNDRRSYPLSTTMACNEPKPILKPSSASFSSPEKRNRDSKVLVSTQSFSSTSVRSSRSFQLDPKVDLRAAVKPSNVKKKRNTGIFFSLNNVLNKKAEKMNKSDAKKRR
uniref:pleckstrin homology domain-containing family A member 1-like n=1 Tax=Styela clava TaxID=7725 RepID=UPI00193A91D8|nr:pleckstrin homology domain-containing family A member 1-like [Styela clava]